MMATAVTLPTVALTNKVMARPSLTAKGQPLQANNFQISFGLVTYSPEVACHGRPSGQPLGTLASGERFKRGRGPLIHPALSVAARAPRIMRSRGRAAGVYPARPPLRAGVEKASRIVRARIEKCASWYGLTIAPSPLMGEGWDEGDTPHLTPLPQGERKLKPKPA